MIQYAPAAQSAHNLPIRPRISPTSSYASPNNPAAPPAHARLHRRGNSLSDHHAPTLHLHGQNSSKIAFEGEVWTMSSSDAPSLSSSKSLKMKPYLRKFAVKDGGRGIDLSRPAAENEGLAGLGLGDYGAGAGSRSASDVNFAPAARTRHHRSASNTSQFSSASSGHQRPSLPYVHPMRQTPRPYTPPISKSYPVSIHDSEVSEEPVTITPHDDVLYSPPPLPQQQQQQQQLEPPRRSGSISSSLASPPTLHLNTSGSFPKFGGNNASQTSLTLGSPHARPRGDTLRSLESATSPSSRPSIDRAFNFMRGRDSPIDPTSRAASIRAARQAYQEKEEAKDRKAQREALRQAEREEKKQAKRDERRRRKSEASEHKARRHIGSESAPPSPAPILSRAYSDHTPAHVRSLPQRVPTAGQSVRTGATPGLSNKRAAKSRWVSFETWVRTRMLRAGDKMHH